MTLEISTKFVMIAFCALIGSAVLLYLYQCWLFEYNASRCSEAKPREDYFETCTEKIDISAHQKFSQAILEFKQRQNGNN